ncbi:uncharacterized protein [Haliotis cracherodii]|uniref:uncharacterized protein n=1 Tax=Haliotis cracherodii TaxID=6455 RepID=UPI0039EBAD63
MFCSKPTRLLVYGTVLLCLVVILPCCAGDFICPEAAELGSPVNLTCIQASGTRAHSYSTPSGTTAASCHLSDRKCIPLGDFSASVLNESCSVLAIPHLLQTHAGDWKCVVDANDPDPETCHISVEKSPSCRILSHNNMRTHRVGEELSLTVNVTGYYCSESVLVQLRTGDITSSLLNETVTMVKDSTVNITFNMTASHFGDVVLVFSCGSKSRHVLCEGLQALDQSISTVPTTQTAVTNRTTTQRASTDDDHTTVIIVVICVITIIILMIILVFLWRRIWINKTSQSSKKYVDVHYVPKAEYEDAGRTKREADPQVDRDAGKTKREADLQADEDAGRIKREADPQVDEYAGKA